jgi:hypothetical protein
MKCADGCDVAGTGIFDYEKKNPKISNIHS